jgi:hypothetical protein
MADKGAEYRSTIYSGVRWGTFKEIIRSLKKNSVV